MTAGGNQGGGVLDDAPFSDYYLPIGLQARLNAIAERFRAENWDVTGSLQRQAERLASVYPDVAARLVDGRFEPEDGDGADL